MIKSLISPVLSSLVDFIMWLRPIWVIPIVLPMSFVARQLSLRRLRSRPLVPLAVHRARVAKLAADVRSARAAGAKRLSTARHVAEQTSTRVHARFKRSCDALIDVSALDGVVEFDKTNQTVTVQPYANMATLTHVLGSQGFRLPGERVFHFSRAELWQHGLILCPL